MNSYTISGEILLWGLGVAAILLLILLNKIMTEDNGLEWWQFISTRAENGKNYADIDKLGKVVGIFVSSWYIIKLGAEGKSDAAVLAVYLGFVGGVAGYSAYLRSQRGAISEKDNTKGG